jgi:hypothetical protein
MVRLSQLDRSKIKPRPREWHLQQVRQFQAAQEALEKRCAELGIPVPVMVCKAVA